MAKHPQEMYDKANQALGDKFHLTGSQIASIRNLKFHRDLSVQESAQWAIEKTKLKRYNSRKPHLKSRLTTRKFKTSYYFELAAFLAKCSEEDYAEITKRFDFENES